MDERIILRKEETQIKKGERHRNSDRNNVQKCKCVRERRENLRMRKDEIHRERV